MLAVNTHHVVERTDCHFNEDLYEKFKGDPSDLDPKLRKVLKYMADHFEDVAELREHAATEFNNPKHTGNPDDESETDEHPKPAAEPEGIYQRLRSRTASANHAAYDEIYAREASACCTESSEEIELKLLMESLTFDAPYPDLGTVETNPEDGLGDWCTDLASACNATLNLPPLPPSPKTIKEAFAGPDAERWRAAIHKELTNLGEAGTFTEAEQTGRGMKMKWVLKASYTVRASPEPSHAYRSASKTFRIH